MELETIVAQIERFMLELETLKPLSAQAQTQFQQKISLDWTYHSNAIEGNRLTFGDTRAFLLRGVTAAGKPFRDYIDIKGHDEAVKLLFALIEQHDTTPLNETFIRELHKIALVEPYRSPSQTMDGIPTTKLILPGQYKTQPNHVRTSTGAIHYYASPEETPAKMGDLVAWYRFETEKGELHPLLIAAAFHYRFVAIHPFDDGNGRLARLLMNFILMRHGFPPVVIPLDKKEQYLRALEQADTGDLELFTTLIGEELLISLNLLIRAAKGENIEEADDLDKKLALLQRKLGAKKHLAAIEAQKTFASTLQPFLVNLLEQLRKFSPLFQSTKCTVKIIGQKTSNSSDLTEHLDNIHALIDNLYEQLNPEADTKGFILSLDWLIYTLIKELSFKFEINIEFLHPGFASQLALYAHHSQRGSLLFRHIYPNFMIEKQGEIIQEITNQIYHEIDARS